MKSNIMKTISYLVLVLGVIGSIINGAIFKTYDLEKQKFVFDIESTISDIVMIIILFLILITISTVLAKLDNIEKSLSEQKRKSNLDSSVVSEAIMSSEIGEESMWKCKQCGQLNSLNSKLCKNCGTWNK